jgi:hypothetical protein
MTKKKREQFSMQKMLKNNSEDCFPKCLKNVISFVPNC